MGAGYVIWNRRISSEVDGCAWRAYSGENTHEHHVHVSVSRNFAGFDSVAPWGIEEEHELSADDTARLARIESKLDEVLTQLYGPRKADGKITGWPQLRGRTLVDAVDLVLDEVEKLPAVTATAVVREPVGAALTVRKGATSTEPVNVGTALTRAAEASVVRQRDEAAAEVVTP